MGYYDQRREGGRSKAKLLGRPKLPKMSFGPMLVGMSATVLSDQIIGEFMRKGVLAGDRSDGVLQRLPRPGS